MTGARAAHPVEILRAELLLTRGPPFTLWRICNHAKPVYHFPADPLERGSVLARQLESLVLQFWRSRDVEELERIAAQLVEIDKAMNQLSDGVWIDGRFIQGRVL